MKANTKKVAVATTKTNATKNTVKEVNTEVSQPIVATGIKAIRETYGKNCIIIKDNMVFRTSTQVLEKGPKSLLDLYLPNYGKMRKFIVKEDGIYEITTDVIQTGTQFAQYTVSDKVNMDISEIDFSAENAWNFKKISDKVATK